MRSATTEEFPWAMLPNGPAWTSTGVFSRVWRRLGLMASFMMTVIAPAARSSSAVTGLPSGVKPTTMRASRLRMSWSEVDRARTAITSEAAVMSKPPCRGLPSSPEPRPRTILRSVLSLTSRTRRHVTRCGSIRRAFPWKMWLSTMAASVLWAAVTACMSPVRCRLRASKGAAWLYPPPAAPPLMPKVGSHRGLADGCSGPLADVAHPLGETDGGGRLSFAERRRGDGRHHHVAGPRLRSPGALMASSLILATIGAIRLQQVGRDPHALGDGGDRLERSRAGDLQRGRKLAGRTRMQVS